jgi:KaiC/GvpD/RAD55 family RecA-like ATPase
MYCTGYKTWKLLQPFLTSLSDAFAYAKFNPNEVDDLSPMDIKPRLSSSGQSYADEDGGEHEYDPSAYREKAKHLPLTDEQLLHCSPLVRGYALKTKRWLSFFVDEVSEITFNSSAFDSLVLPVDQKELILAFASFQIEHKESFDDVIAGKGKGIIMLLSGGPGIGKTLTAESVAGNMKVPLYMMSASDLGVESTEVESNITKILEMVAKWNAVLLLDECDVFLEARSTRDLERNKVVSIFLRTLEYYEGILLLTTNRVKDMDPAFQSRIHIAMEYPAFNKESRAQVWSNFLRNAEHELTLEQLDVLAKVEINGRQIKNHLKTAGLLAKHKGCKLRYEHLRTVLNIQKQGLAP